MLSWSEASVFLRFGEDMRRPTWPPQDFLRASATMPKPLAGYDILNYTPTDSDQSATDWSKP